MAATCDLLDVDPPELQFPFVLGKQISCPLRLTNRTSSTIAFKLLWYVWVVGQDNEPQEVLRAAQQWRCAAALRLHSCRFNELCAPVVKMQAQTVAPPDLQCKDKFLVQSVVVSDGSSAKDITSQMFMKEGGNAVEEVKLKVSYVMPPEPASEIAEEHDGSSRTLVPMQRIVDNVRSTSELLSSSVSLRSAEEFGSPVGRIVKSDEYLKAATSSMETKTSTGPAEQSPQLLDIIAKLTEEKNSALEQNRMLLEELELVRREVSNKQQGDVSLILMLAVVLLSIVLGYLVKK